MLNIPNLNKKSSQKFAGDLEFGPLMMIFCAMDCFPGSGKPSNLLGDTFPDPGNRQNFLGTVSWQNIGAEKTKRRFHGRILGPKKPNGGFMAEYWRRKNQTEVLWQNIGPEKTKRRFYGRILAPQKRIDGFNPNYWGRKKGVDGFRAEYYQLQKGVDGFRGKYYSLQKGIDGFRGKYYQLQKNFDGALPAGRGAGTFILGARGSGWCEGKKRGLNVLSPCCRVFFGDAFRRDWGCGFRRRRG
jgi:hypothetical protein